MTLTTQFTAMMSLALLGTAVAAVIDVYHQSLRPQKSAHRYITDSLIFVINGVLVYYVIFQINGGSLRFYFVLAFLLGISTYFALIQSWFWRLLTTILNILSIVFRTIERIIYYVIVWPIKWLFVVMLGFVTFWLNVLWRLLVGILRLVQVIVSPFVPRIVKMYLHFFWKYCDNRLKTVWSLIRIHKKKRRRQSYVQEKEVDGER
ncbi:spore cortex biosynthesis protein YabQ [Alkalibacillus flavidus]|uniref:Spore cortex biosynthesis protein YabQ n=1 Tax=Alkalibacillus flavidus TaxID=546021 RepID=A0ABV2KVY5_9BACI